MNSPHRLVRESTRSPRLPLAAGLRSAFSGGYGADDLRRDVLAGLVVGMVALPLSMALAIASGVPPQHGLYTAIIAGFLIAGLGGSRFQVSGPTAAFVVLLAPISTRFGLAGLAVATVLAGVVLIGFGVGRMGKFIEFIPYPVTTGFTSGIAIVIATLQVKDFLGLTVAHMPEHYIERVGALVRSLPTMKMGDPAIGVLTLGLLVLLPRWTRKVPSPLVALPAAALAGWLLHRYWPAMTVATIQDRFSYVVEGVTHAGIPQLPPLLTLPWNLPGPSGGALVLSYDVIQSLVASAFAIAILGAIESLLSAVVADGMTGERHDPDSELLAQGIGNVVAPFFGGFAATGAIARTATNIRAGARSPIAAMVHALFVLASVLLFARLLGFLPMASLAALLLVVAWNMAEVKHVARVLRIAPRSDVLVLLTCFGLTVIFDMVVSVTAGVVLAAILFMQRMAEVSGAKQVGDEHPAVQLPLPKGVLLYEIAGPLFFGAAQKAMSSLRTIERGVRCVVLNMQAVPVIDATGIVNLESALERLWTARVLVILAGVQPGPRAAMTRAGIAEEPGRLVIRESFDAAVALARAYVTVHDEPLAAAPAGS